MMVSPELEAFTAACTGCGVCQEACPFLGSCGTPGLLLTERPGAAFFCTGCGLCRRVCPEGLDPAAALREAKRALTANGEISPAVAQALRGARRYARSGQRFPFRHYSLQPTAFWPGCGLAGASPAMVRTVRETLERRLEEPVGIVLDCCFDPLYQLGDTDAVEAACRSIRDRLVRCGITRLVTGCLNCRKVLAGRLSGIRVEFVLDLLYEEIMPEGLPEAAVLHHPCPAGEFPTTRERIAERIGHRPGSEEIGSLIACCGNGGAVPLLSHELADRFTRRITDQAGERTIVTYCSGCAGRFGKAGVKANHLLWALPGAPPEEPPPSPLRQWGNRLLLALGLHMQKSKIVIALIVALLAGGGIFLGQRGGFSTEALLSLLGAYPLAAPLIFMLIYAVAPALFLPSIPLSLAAGFFWGPVWGVLFAITGATAGACVSFFLARYLLRDAVRTRFAAGQWHWLEENVVKHGWKAVAFVRLIPVFPFNVLNYLLGLTPLSFGQYLWSSVVFMLPGCIAFVAFGSSLGELILQGSIRGLLVGGAVAALALILVAILKPRFRKIAPLPQDGNPAGGREKGAER
ncbi:MAG: VTT domain-containing protein [Syntrophales bacterium]